MTNVHFRVILNEDRSDALCQRIPIFEESGNLTVHISRVTCEWCMRKIAKMQRKESLMIQELDSNEMLHMQKEDYNKDLENAYAEGYTEGRRELAEHIMAHVTDPSLRSQMYEVLNHA